ncbi:AGC family protein kinase [Trichomonas vaginalis G3]|uniref:AGC family protein kinase n=1 Tax=Trichomonas vaginalis (strain ATCC PRA-98 / G3) TaxID=412133 RepID=A2ET80_TRIV3|nr:regulation of centriole replication [Trichomonas vaginalis G3]EAY04133.1 AGC family protein kinase [Trichomonas vaginalis G3]KAI5549886.1 regulation of centriole replication [Trichomonas vaginalis G3]|eukprot:XP_001316356.1 AGC family protein kinase [Trichomonas vaginalis G3]
MKANIVTILKYHDYEIVKYLDHDSYRSCFLIKSLKYDMNFVCKVSRTTDLPQEYLASFYGEAEILSKLNHPNIVRIYDYFIEQDISFIILEYCSNGSLLDLVKTQKRITQEKINKYTLQIVDALSFMHSKGIAHCDIKLSNILIDQYDRAKLCDFGLSHYITNDSNKINDNKIRGTLNYMAPEVIIGKEFCPFKSDVWSFGVTFPFISRDPFTILRDIKNGYIKIFPRYGPLARIADQCLNLDPLERPTMAQIKFKIYQLCGDSLEIKPRSTSRILTSVARQQIVVHHPRITRLSASAVY